MCECRSPRRSSSVDELGQRALARRLELAAALAQLRLDVGQPERRVDLLLGRAAHRLARRVVEDPVLGDVQPLRTAASRSCTLWSLEPVKCCSTLPNWSGATTLRSTFRPAWVVARAPAGPRLLHGLHDRQLLQRRDERRRVVGGGDHVEVLDGVDLAAQRARHLDAVGAGRGAQRLRDLLGDRERAGEQDPRRRRAVGARGERLEQLLLDLRAEAAQPAHLLALAGRAQRLERVDAELVEQPRARASGRSRAGA